MGDWTPQDAELLYGVADWSGGYFAVSESGNIEVLPDGTPESPRIDLFEQLNTIRRRGVRPPILMRFDGILRSRVRELYAAFDAARAEYDYPAPYRLIYPIKVNQDRHVVESLIAEGRAHGMGLEVGSKPELLAVLTMDTGSDPLVICNGYKDDEYIETALLARRLGITTVLVIEKYSELDSILRAADALGIEPVVGVRAKLSVRGSGRWQESGGDRSKFGLTTREIVMVADVLKERGSLHWLQLLHFHLGSQITNIRSLKTGMHEAAQTLVGLHELGARLSYMDIGGGLGIDYDGSRTDFDSSMNYSMTEYAKDVVWQLFDICNQSGIEPPTILSESGRALTAHHAVLVTEVLGVSEPTSVGIPDAVETDETELLHEIQDANERISAKTFQEVFNDIRELRERAMMLFNMGQLTLRERARFEEIYWRSCEKILRLTRRMEYVPEDMEPLERDLAQTLFLNFSLFQSLPDSWAIGQMFPVLPIHRLGEEPLERAILADITCDSDGKVDKFIDRRDVKNTLEVHELHPGEPYYLAFFLVGAYQEILGDMHNLFGDTNVVHVDVDDDGRPRLRHIFRGDRVRESLSYVHYEEDALLSALRKRIEASLDVGHLTYEESALLWKHYEDGLNGYTYLNRTNNVPAADAPAGTRS
ncbi:MAG: biosynthetic arginine decarboxylase [Planctomycetes bacterium]|nr:biosynthetic arginine decarboxylase [Planctomycetota bacterium]